MGIRISPHTLERAEERGADETEIKDVLSTGFSVPAKYGRMGKGKIYEFGRTRHGKHYDQKRLEVLYIREDDDLVVITVYVFYGRWESQDADPL